MKHWIAMALAMLWLLPFASQAEEQIQDLDQLLAAVKQQQAEQRELNRQREREFLADKRQQQQLLQKAKSDFEKYQQENQPLLAVTDQNAKELARLEKELAGVVGDMGDLSSTFREFAGDFSAVLRESMLSAQFPQRLDQAQALADADTEVSIEEIQALWLLLQEDMTESGKVAQFPVAVIDSAGAMQSVDVLRVGVFSAWSGGDFLRYVPETAELLSLSRQPPVRFRNAASEFAQADSGIYTLAIDPTRGSLLGMLSFTPDLRETYRTGRNHRIYHHWHRGVWCGADPLAPDLSAGCFPAYQSSAASSVEAHSQ